VRNMGEDTWTSYSVNGADQAFIDTSTIELAARAPGYESDEAVWQALSSGENVAVVDNRVFEDDGGFGGASEDRYAAPDGVAVEDGAIPAFSVELLDPQTGKTETFEVIGVISNKVSLLSGIFIAHEPFTALYGTGDLSSFYVQNGPATDDSGDLAEGIEAALQTQGVQAVSIDEELEERQSGAENFFTLIQGFMALGLLVGIAALGVISFRSVVERRRQIGMLRAIGFEQGMVGAAFVLESLVVAAVGVVTGAALSLILSYNLVMGGGIDDNTQFESFVVPWSNVAFFIIAALVAAALMTWIPARQASRVPIADALRYE